MNTPNPIVDRIAKLLRLADSPNENEATAAAEKAQDLLLKHGLDLADIATAQGDGIATDKTEVWAKLDDWRFGLAGAVAESVGGTCMMGSRPGAATGLVTFYGPAGTTDGAAQMFEFLAARLERFALVDTATRRDRQSDADEWRDSYLWGAVYRIAERLERRKRAVQVDRNPHALVLVGNAAERAMHDENPGLQAHEHDPAVDNVGAFFAGDSAAAVLPLGDAELRKTPTQIGPA